MARFIFLKIKTNDAPNAVTPQVNKVAKKAAQIGPIFSNNV
jgi:hypothetical protein